MNVLIIGGAGVFGSRLAKLLGRDGHAVTIAGRNLDKLQARARDLGCAALQIDLRGDLSVIAEFDVVVDAAGPFHTYGDAPYRLVETAIRSGVHYLDLSDNAAFSQRIAQFDKEARSAGLCAISGMSSVPALSSAVVRSLIDHTAPDHIDIAILPGNRSPRGLSVMASILSQAGQPLQITRAGQSVTYRGWSDPKHYDLPDGLKRQGWVIEVPDVALFPGHFGAQTVIFRAGLELAVMRYGLWAFAQLRRRVPLPITTPVLQGFKLVADLLKPFGGDRGGMSVEVRTGKTLRWWRLLVEAGDGPYIPTIAIRALLRRDRLPMGATPALETITLQEAEAAMADLKVRCESGTRDVETLFPKTLGPTFGTLPAKVRATHETYDISHWHGQASVHRGKGLWSTALGALFGFPPASEQVAVSVTKSVTKHGETWERQFGDRRFRSHLSATPAGMSERFGPFTFALALAVDQDGLHFPVVAGRLGPIPLPKWLLPISIAREYQQNNRFHFDVKLLAPVSRSLLVHYQGHLAPADSQVREQTPERT